MYILGKPFSCSAYIQGKRLTPSEYKFIFSRELFFSSSKDTNILLAVFSYQEDVDVDSQDVHRKRIPDPKGIIMDPYPGSWNRESGISDPDPTIQNLDY